MKRYKVQRKKLNQRVKGSYNHALKKYKMLLKELGETQTNANEKIFCLMPERINTVKMTTFYKRNI